MRKNPNKYIRAAYITALSNVGCPVFNKMVPKSTKPVPSTYILLSTQTKARTANTKCGYDIDASILIDIISVQELGFANTSSIDDIEEKVINAIEAMTTVNGFILKDTRLEDSYESNIDTDTQSIWRNLVRFTHVLSEVG